MKRLLPLLLGIAAAGAAEPLIVELDRPGGPLRLAVDGSEFEVAAAGERSRVAVAGGAPARLGEQAALLARQRPGARVEAVARVVGTGRQAVITRQLAVRPPAGADPAGWCAANGLRLLRQPSWARGLVIAETVDADPLAAIAAERRLRAAGFAAEAQVRLPLVLHATPNDPRFVDASQWYLNAGSGINLVGHWAGPGPYYTGAGLNVAVLDSGLDLTHEDLAAGVRTDLDLDVLSGDADASHGLPAVDNGHGTVVAGLIGARANNALGIAGVAADADLVPVRMIGPGAIATSAESAEALAYRSEAASDVIAVSNNSWGPQTNGNLLGPTSELIEAALAAGTDDGRDGRGTIYVFSAGNGRATLPGSAGPDSADFNAFASHRRAIGVAATGITGVVTSYSCPGAGLLIAAPGGADTANAMASTDWTDATTLRGFQTGAYTARVTPAGETAAVGTSFAAPLVAGAAAMLIQADPRLSWRDIPWVLALSANPRNEGDQISNNGGLNWDVDYGAGLLDVQAALALVAPAGTWTPLPPELSYSASSSAVAQPFTSIGAVDATQSFTFAAGDLAGFVVERAVVTVNVTHPTRGDVDLTLASPGGTEAVFAGRDSDNVANLVGFSFTTPWMMGERGTGTWTITASASSGAGSLGACTLTLYGYKPYAVPAIVRQFPSAMVVGDASVEIAVDGTGLAVSQGGDVVGTLVADAVSKDVTADVAGWPSATFTHLGGKLAGDTVNVQLVNPQVRQADSAGLGGGGTSNTVTLAVRAVGANLAPVATLPTTPGSVVAGQRTTSGVAAFTDPDGDTLRYRIVTMPTLGSATIDVVTGVVTFAPGITTSGPDSLVVEATDGIDVSTSTITYTVRRNPVGFLDVTPVDGPAGDGGGATCGAGAGGGMLGLFGVLALIGLRRRRR